MTSTRHDLPTPDETTETFWAATAEGKLLIKRCMDCERVHAYPRPFCPYCWSENVDWAQATGRATLYTFSIVRQNDLPPFGDRVPYVAAIVDLEEGPRLMTNVVDCAPEDVYIGMALQFSTRATDEFAVPVFGPAE